MLGLCPVCHDTRLTVHPNPPQPVPVLLVVVDKNGDGWVRGNVAEPLEVRSSFRLGVNGEIENLPIEGKANRHDMRSAITPDGGQARHPSRIDAPAILSRIHSRSVSVARAKQVGPPSGYG